jgi:hypothetical protein
MPIRIGEALVAEGLLTQEQVAQVLEAQQVRHRPFGVLAEELFDLDEGDVERAWVRQFTELAHHVDASALCPADDARNELEARQCWQFGVYPLRLEGDELVLATTPTHLLRALRFTMRVLERPCSFVLTSADALARALESHFPMPGLNQANLAAVAERSGP